MNRHDRDDYGRYQDFDRDDRHYHSARNLTDQFEREYQQERGYRHDDQYPYQREHSYHEGDMGDMYERMQREGNTLRGDSSFDMIGRGRRYPEDYNDVRNRYSNYQDDYRSYSGLNRRNRDDDNAYNTYNNYRGQWAGDRRDYHPGSGGDDRRSRYEGSKRYHRSEDNWYGSGHRRDELNRYY